MNPYRKTIVAVIGAIVSILAIYGINVNPELVAAITTLLTAAAVFALPNDPV